MDSLSSDRTLIQSRPVPGWGQHWPTKLYEVNRYNTIVVMVGERIEAGAVSSAPLAWGGRAGEVISHTYGGRHVYTVLVFIQEWLLSLGNVAVQIMKGGSRCLQERGSKVEDEHYEMVGKVLGKDRQTSAVT